MKKIFFLIFLSPFLYSQEYQIKDSLKVLAMSNFKSMEVFKHKNGKLVPERSYSYDQSKNKITIKNTSLNEKEWVMTIVTLDKNYNIKEEERVTQGKIISNGENRLIDKQTSVLTKYSYDPNSVQLEKYNYNGNLVTKEFCLLDDKNYIVEKIILFSSSNNIVISEIEKYNWINSNSYNYEKLTFNFPRTKITGLYNLNEYGEIEFFKGNMTVNDHTEAYDYNLQKKIKQFDSRRNIIKVYTLVNGKENILEERKIIY